MKQIKRISAFETVAVRQPVLRKGMPVATCHFVGDELSTTTHFGFFENEILIGVVSLFENKNGTFIDTNQFQIRGMAILENHQKKGIGKALIHHCETFVSQQNGDLIWFNARENALPFYTKMGFEIIGNPFEIEPIGMHYLMNKRY